MTPLKTWIRLDAAHELSRHRPDVRVLILSMHENEQYLYEALKAGASGYAVKTVAVRELVEASRAAMRGEAVPLPGGNERGDPGPPAPRP